MIYSILVGALCGWIASRFMKTDEEMGAFKNIVAGVIGGVIGHWAFRLIGMDLSGSLGGDIISGVVGACIFIAIIKAFRNN